MNKEPQYNLSSRELDIILLTFDLIIQYHGSTKEIDNLVNKLNKIKKEGKNNE